MDCMAPGAMYTMVPNFDVVCNNDSIYSVLSDKYLGITYMSDLLQAAACALCLEVERQCATWLLV